MQHAIDLNNEGSLLLSNGFFEDAVAIFNDALAMVQTDLTSSEHDDDEVDEDQQEAQEQEPEQQHCRQDVIPTTTSTEKKDSFSQSTTRMMQGSEQGSEERDQDNDNSDDEVFIYRNPIFISSPPRSSSASSSSSAPSMMDYSTLSITIVFNLALAHQLTAMSQDMEPRRLYTALKLYEVGYLMQRNATSQGCNTSSSTTTTRFLSLSHTLGLVNNCGQIYQQLGQPKRAQRFFTTLLSTLILLGKSEEKQDQESNNDERDNNNNNHNNNNSYCTTEHFEGFWKTASQLILTDPQLASAA